MFGLSLLLVAALAVALYMAWNVGANDVANAFGTSVGSGAITLKRAIVLAAIFEFAGAFLVGKHVSETVRSGIIDKSYYTAAADATPEEKARIDENRRLLAYGMFSALLGAAVWLNVATRYGLPVSTTHSIVGAIFGFGLVQATSYINWEVLAKIVLSWVVSPLCGAVIAYFVFRSLQRLIFVAENPVQNLRRYSPALIFLTLSVLGLTTFYKGLKPLKLDLSFGKAALISVAIGLVGAAIAYALIRTRARRQILEDDYAQIERTFTWYQLLSACTVAFAHGANDVANAIGPLASVWSIEHSSGSVESNPIILVIGSIGIVIGLATYGRRVIETVGKKITDLTPTRGFSAEFGAAVTVLACSRMGLPISTTHTLVGSVIGVGFARGIGALDLSVIRSIVNSWLVTIPAAAVVTLASYGAMRLFLG